VGGTDYALLRCRETLDDGRIIIVLRSITTPHIPPVQGHQRGELLPSGFLVTPRGPGGCLVEYLVQLDSTSAQHFRTELRGRTNLLRRSLRGLAALAAPPADASHTPLAASSQTAPQHDQTSAPPAPSTSHPPVAPSIPL
jgi:hypothetical protein